MAWPRELSPKEKPESELFRAPEFWEEEERASRGEMVRQSVRWLLFFVALFAFGCFVMWWAGQAVSYGTNRSTNTHAKATWRLFGIVRDEDTGEPVAFARIADGPKAKPPHFASTADHLGHFEMHTLPERHEVTASALGYRPRTRQVGREWFSWMPSGDERLDFLLKREAGR